MIRKLSELGISPAPWKCHSYYDHKHDLHLGEVHVNVGRFKIVVDISQPDARMMAASPDMYEALWDLCYGDVGTVNCAKCGGDAHGIERCAKTCKFYKARMALAKASGMIIKEDAE